VSPAFDIPPVNPQPQASTSRTGPGFWPGVGVGCAVSFVGLLLLFVMSGIVALALGVNKAMTFTGAAKAKRDAMVAMAEEAGDQAAKGGAAAKDPAADAADAMSVEELEIQSALDSEDFDRAEQLARALVDRHKDDPSARALLQTVRIERAVAAEDISSADALLKEARKQGLDIEPTAELGVAELWLSEGEPQRSLDIADRVLKALDADAAATAAPKANDPASADADPGAEEDAEADADYDRYVRGVALLIRGLARAELGDPAAGAVDIAAAVELAPDEETAADWREYLDDVREKSR
jgi:hypothetical protein